jgi:hypothetical protein
MRLQRLFIALAALTFFYSTDIFAQAGADPRKPAGKKSPILVGPVFGYNKSMHSGGFASIATDANCPTFESGTENGFYVGMTGEYLLGDPKNANSSIIFRAMYDYQPATFTVAGDEYPSKIVTTQQEVKSAVQHVTVVKYTLLNFELMYRINIPGTMLGITAGPQFGIPIGGTQEQRFELQFNPANPVQFVAPTEPGSLKLAGNEIVGRNGFRPEYTDDTRTAIRLYQGDIISRNSFRAALKFGLQYEILAGSLLIVPAAYYNLGLTNINTTDNWSVSAFQIGADIRFSL